jgi:hypothetical protein
MAAMKTAAEELSRVRPEGPLLTALSFGVGQDSSGLLARLIEEPDVRREVAPVRLVVVASDTGDEHRHTYEHLGLARRRCERAGLPFFWLTPELGFHSPAWASLPAQWRRSSTVGIKAGKKSCTDNLKIKPFYRFLSSYVRREFGVRAQGSEALVRFAGRYGPIRVLIGFTADETGRVIPDGGREEWQRAAVEFRYPLIEWGWLRRDCVSYLQGRGYAVPFPSNCRRCPYSTKLDVLWLARNDPQAFAEWVEFERRKLEKFADLGGRNHAVFGAKRLPEVLAEARAAFGHLSDAELNRLKFSRGHCVRSRY